MAGLKGILTKIHGRLLDAAQGADQESKQVSD